MGDLPLRGRILLLLLSAGYVREVRSCSYAVTVDVVAREMMKTLKEESSKLANHSLKPEPVRAG